MHIYTYTYVCKCVGNAIAVSVTVVPKWLGINHQGRQPKPKQPTEKEADKLTGRKACKQAGIQALRFAKQHQWQQRHQQQQQKQQFVMGNKNLFIR